MSILPDKPRSIDEYIARWLRVKLGRTDSVRTPESYQAIIQRFRDDLRRVDLDLDSPTDEVVEAAEVWLNTPWDRSRKQVSAATFNQRKSAISSFYDYVIRQNLMKVDNPMVRIERRRAQSTCAPSLKDDLIEQRLLGIDQSDSKGIRDYAIITVAVFTGKRASELLSMTVGSLALESDGMRITWERLKEGKKQEEVLEFPHATALLRHLHRQFGAEWKQYPASTAVWTSLAHNKHGAPLTYNGLTSIYKSRLGVSKVHSTRRYFANALIRLGAQAPEVKDRMNHASLLSTQPYFDEVDTTRNPRVAGIAGLIGLPQS